MDLSKASVMLRQARSVAVLTGAGVSQESGVPTFRGKGGYWQGRSAMELASPEGFKQDPQTVWQWYNHRRDTLREISPNPGHTALAQMEAHFPQFGLITQNVDRLHHKAGSQSVCELHGNLWQVKCQSCSHQRLAEEKLEPEPKCPECGDWLRPAVVWFGESLPEEALATAHRWSASCDVFLVIGTSGVVQPAASFAWLAREQGAQVIEINLESTPISEGAHCSLFAPSAQVLPDLLDSLKTRETTP